jgi:hypothetical protein
MQGGDFLFPADFVTERRTAAGAGRITGIQSIFASADAAYPVSSS